MTNTPQTIPPERSVSDGLPDWLRDIAATFRGDADGLVGGMRNRVLADADDCERWASEVESQAQTIERLRAGLEEIGARDVVEAMIDPGWSARRANEILKPKDPS